MGATLSVSSSVRLTPCRSCQLLVSLPGVSSHGGVHVFVRIRLVSNSRTLLPAIIMSQVLSRPFSKEQAPIPAHKIQM